MNLRDGSGISLLLLLCLATMSQVFLKAEAVWLSIPNSGTKCLSEEIQTNVVVLGDYYVVTEEGPQLHTVSAKVTSPYGMTLHHNENVTQGQFAFTTTESGNYEACFWMDGKHQDGATASVSIDWKIGISAKDWDSVAKKEKIEGVELEIRKLEGIVEAIHGYLIYLKDKEAKMREVSERTNGRVAWFSIMSLGLCILVSALQLWYLKHYFRKKKLI
ncbi:transmembrane emp24 domain-containing protein p24delta4-like [Cicer arietinum]|uniref:Transmembrane emp24 domain-containing protein p24delta4-like n=1 Tax=Cicer arietinum TaxID=3827 RepID=A0A1S2XL80_CICAR|nr:transmembrane emp24 domain-containing protein p24delta4-like [Cicer arietinum]